MEAGAFERHMGQHPEGDGNDGLADQDQIARDAGDPHDPWNHGQNISDGKAGDEEGEDAEENRGREELDDLMQNVRRGGGPPITGKDVQESRRRGGGRGRCGKCEPESDQGNVDQFLSEDDQRAEGVCPLVAGRRHLVGEEMEERFGDIQTAEDMLEHGAAVVAVGLAGEQVGICAWDVNSVGRGGVSAKRGEKGGCSRNQGGKIVFERRAQSVEARHIDDGRRVEKGKGSAIDLGEEEIIGAGARPAQGRELIFVLDQADGAVAGVLGRNGGVQLAGDVSCRRRELLSVVGGGLHISCLQGRQGGGLFRLPIIGRHTFDRGADVVRKDILENGLLLGCHIGIDAIDRLRGVAGLFDGDGSAGRRAGLVAGR